MQGRCFRKKRPLQEDDHDAEPKDEEEHRLVLEEVKLLQKQRERRSGIAAGLPAQSSPRKGAKAAEGGLISVTGGGGGGGDGEKDDLVLQDTFAQETAVTVEDPNMLSYVEQELAKRRGKKADDGNLEENELKRVEDELYAVPEHLKVRKRNANESSTQWTTGIAEVQLPIEYKLKNIEETEAAKKLLQEKRLAAAGKAGKPEQQQLNIPSSYSADYFQRGRDYAERLRRDHPELYRDKVARDATAGAAGANAGDAPFKADAGGRRQAATDELMLERFRKRERNRAMRR